VGKPDIDPVSRRAKPRWQRCLELVARTMNDEQFRAIRGLLVTIIILLDFITGILLAMAWEYL
jgi:hypothetical protein